MSELQKKSVRETRVVLSHVMQTQYANNAGNVHGGSIMKFIDDAAAVAVIRHARRNVVTASIDRLDFHEPVFVGDLLHLKASVNNVGRTSLEAGVRVEAEDMRTGKIRHTASAYLTFVALDKEGRPVEVPGLILETEEEKSRYEAAILRKEERRKFLVKKG